MDKELKDRVFAFKTLSLPGQPTFMHMGTSYLVSDLESALLNVEAERDRLRELLREVRPYLNGLGWGKPGVDLPDRIDAALGGEKP